MLFSISLCFGISIYCCYFYFRVGWSVIDSDLSLGEDKLSYGFGGTGKAATNRQFKDYGEDYGPGDFISCFVVSREEQF